MAEIALTNIASIFLYWFDFDFDAISLNSLEAQKFIARHQKIPNKI